MSDSEMPSVFSDIIRKARRDHKCCECKQIIKTGDKYHLAKGCWFGKWDEFKICLDCEELRKEISDLYRRDEIPPFGYLAEWAEESNFEFPVTKEMR